MPRLSILSHEERTDRRLCSILSIRREENYHARHKKCTIILMCAWRRATDPLVHVPFLGAKEPLYVG